MQRCRSWGWGWLRGRRAAEGGRPARQSRLSKAPLQRSDPTQLSGLRLSLSDCSALISLPCVSTPCVSITLEASVWHCASHTKRGTEERAASPSPARKATTAMSQRSRRRHRCSPSTTRHPLPM